MEDSTLLIISIAGSLIGIILLYFGTIFVEPELVNAEEIDSEKVGEYVKVEGKVQNIREVEDNLLISLENTDLVIFVNKKFALEVYNGAFISVSGVVHEYNGKIEIIPNRPDEVNIIGPVY